MSSLNDLVSVVIPVYNSEKFLNESITSVLNQTYKNIEIFAINDGSTDNSLKILQNFSNQINIINNPHQGIPASINSGIKLMKGKWFKYFSSDDILFPHSIELLVNNSQKFPKNTILYSNWEIINEQGKTLRQFKESNYNNLNKFEFNVRLLDGQQINLNTTLIPKEIFEQGCLFRQLDDPIAPDYDFFLRAALLYDYSFHLIDDYLVQYRIHSDQLSHKRIIQSLEYLSDLKKNLLSQLNEKTKNLYEKEIKNYQKNKPISKKTIELGLELSKNLPEWLTDKLLIFYLNQIRSSR